MPATSPASPFAALLRRSKFAQYDPHIGQVYATYGGDAARGHWGLKRPLSLRKRHAHITVKSVDSPEQQTEWKHAEQQARFIKMYDEVGIPPQARAEKSWYHKLGSDADWRWTVDSEFATRDTKTPPSGKLEEQSQGVRLPDGVDPERARAALESGIFADRMPTPNINAMSEKEFAAYLKKLRKLRPQFLEYVKTREAAQTSKDRELPPMKSFWDLAQKTNMVKTSNHKYFLSHLQYQKYNDPSSRIIEQQPHKFAGLTYSHHNDLQGRLYAPPKPGRMLIKASATVRNSNSEDMKVSFAGMSADLPSALRADKGPLNWRKLATIGEPGSEDGIALMRMVEVDLIDAPEVVGEEPQNLDQAYIAPKVQVISEQSGVATLNPFRPGSKEYIAHVESRSKQKKQAMPFIDHKPNIHEQYEAKDVSKVNLLDTLRDMINT